MNIDTSCVSLDLVSVAEVVDTPHPQHQCEQQDAICNRARGENLSRRESADKISNEIDKKPASASASLHQKLESIIKIEFGIGIRIVFAIVRDRAYFRHRKSLFSSK